MSMVQVEDFRQHGYVVIDNFISREAAARIKAEAMRLNQRGVQLLLQDTRYTVCTHVFLAPARSFERCHGVLVFACQ
jgi:hypothetical protein